jgi:glycosyltransferase involved in cell wall biosynthesis
MLKEETLWFDFTTSFHWPRPPVGIVRMEQECCRWLLSKWSERVRICVFDQGLGKFLEITHQEAWAILSRVWDTTAPEAPALPEPAEPAAPAEPVAPVEPVAAAATPALEVPTEAQTPPTATSPGIARRIARLLRKSAHALLRMLPERYRAGAQRRLAVIWRAMAFGYREWMAASVSEPNEVALQTDSPPPAPTPPPVQAQSPQPAPPPQPPIASFSANDCYLTMGLDWDHNKMDFLYREKKRTGAKIFNVAYDIIPVMFPHFYQSGKFDLFSLYFSTLAWTSDHVFCISRCTAHDLGKLLEDTGTPKPPMTVIRLGDTLPTTRNREHSPIASQLINERYLLFVSTIEIRKNHETLYKTCIRLIESGFDVPKIVFVGMPGWRVDDLLYSLQNDPRIKEKIVVLNHVTDEELQLLYKHCLFTLYPSLYEGWGLPVAESLAHGKFCLASNAASVPEIAADIIDYADPWDVPEWAKKIKFYCSNPAELQKREELIASRYQITSWEATVDQMMTVIAGKQASTTHSA